MNYLNQSLDSILSLILAIAFFFLISVIISFRFLKIHKDGNSFLKALVPNLASLSVSYILYAIAIRANINIAVFSRDEKNESVILIGSFLIAMIIASFIGILSYKMIFKSAAGKKYSILLLTLNAISYALILFLFYPKSYVNKDILSYNRHVYTPDKTTLKLFDNSTVEIDTACSSEDNYKIPHMQSLFNFRIHIKNVATDRFLYSFKLLDKSKDAGGEGEDDNCKVIAINSLENEVKVLFVQKNPDKNIGWETPITTDTITFRKIRTEKRQAGYYGDTDCDCIEK